MRRIFISYCHKDEDWKDRLLRHLRVLEREDVIRIWDDRQIGVGEDWRTAIGSALEEADLAILLVTADFLISDFIRGEEVPRLLERRAEEGMRLFPIIVR